MAWAVFTSLILAKRGRGTATGAGSITRWRMDRSITEVVHPILTPNGIGLSPDGKTLYVAETETARLWAFDVLAPGVLGKAPFPSPHGGRLMVGLGGFQRFDSLAVDAAGNVCVATLVNGSVSVIAPEGGLLRQVPMPDMFCTNICFGGPIGGRLT